MRLRPTVRLLVVDERRRVLLFKFEDAVALDPARPDLRIYWVTPGGGVEEGETYEQAAHRELWEETGISLAELGPWVWIREKTMHFPDESVHFVERYYLAWTTSGQVNLDNLLPHEIAVYRDHRWWSVEEIERSDEVFLPPGLLELLRPLLAGRIPEQPLQLEP
jgi:8-oxo-dGTP pyrophosphatase MutT (NUDIX family)